MNFEVKELDKVFDELYLVNDVSKTLNQQPQQDMGEMKHPNTQSGFNSDIKLSIPEGGVSIADLHTNAESYVGKKVKLIGKVVKFNEAILSTNWIHIQDGTGSESQNNFDLTLTTKDVASVGDVIVIEGILNKDVDFGSGYKYDLIVQEATIVSKEQGKGTNI
jgi:hypothetical protein